MSIFNITKSTFMPFFDFHCHPGLKPQFSKPATKPSPWEYIDAKLAVGKGWTIRINTLFNEVLNSQSNLTQLFQNDVRLIGVILHAVEKKICVLLADKSIVNKGNINLIDKNRLTYLASGKHSFELINEELEWLTASASPIPGAQFKIVSKPADFEETDYNTVFGIIIIEGLHCFFDDPDAGDAKEKFTQNFNSFTDAHTVVSMNICHMQQNPFCNHAYGIQLFNPAVFYPKEQGITKWGNEVINLMISKKILVDIKHMSLQARLDLYRMFKLSNPQPEYLQPIICTHAGTTGLPIIERVKYIESIPGDKGSVYEVVYLKPKSRFYDDVYHNCSSINLYDEDIENIFLSEGIIGLSFDQRILGFGDDSGLTHVIVPHDVEYISHKEAGFFFGPTPENLQVWPVDTNVWASEDFADLEPAAYPDLHRRFLINNIMHILWVASQHSFIGINKAAKQICIGTDFDGLINAIDCCKNANGLQQLKEDMRQDLADLLNSNGFHTLNVDALLEDIFYNNGKNFMLKRLKEMKGS
ncbi:MAG: membrane dipeptidase [Chitinophagaceae bacterium]|nr:membrane dipeptidase [Chitinophagaceae bacterium]